MKSYKKIAKATTKWIKNDKLEKIGQVFQHACAIRKVVR